MNPKVLRRFIIYMGVATVAMFTVWAVVGGYFDRPPGDYYTEKGDINLSDGHYDAALEDFNKALQEAPNHRGALMGRALVFIFRKDYDQATAELTYLIGYLEKNLEPNDHTGRAALAAAYANRGIIHDRQGQYREALADYVQSLKIDSGAVEGPDWIDKLLYGNPHPSTVRDRARYLYEQLQLPEAQRVMRIPELDAEQRPYKPR